MSHVRRQVTHACKDCECQRRRRKLQEESRKSGKPRRQKRMNNLLPVVTVATPNRRRDARTHFSDSAFPAAESKSRSGT